MFAVSAFLLAQPGHTEMGHHAHTPAQVLEGVRRGLPTLLLVREPEDTILSFVIRYPEIPLRQALKSYVAFHRTLWPVRHQLVVATFDQVVTDFGRVTARLNSKFGTSFAEFEHNEENVRAAFDWIDRGDRKSFGSSEELERSTARPVPSREALKARLRDAYRDRELAGLRAQAEELYARFAALAGN